MVYSDYIIIGGGIVGVATALEIQRKFPHQTVTLLEKETSLASHQTGRNSGVIHAGVYYKPNSLKATFCKQGLLDTVAFCQKHQIKFNQCGKLIIATTPTEEEALENLKQNAHLNGIDAEPLSRHSLIQLEPHLNGLSAIKISQTGIVNYKEITNKMAELFIGAGGSIVKGCTVTQIDETDKSVLINSNLGQFTAQFLISCAGLQADRIVKAMGLSPDFSIIPFRGEYYQLPSHLNSITNHLVYPVPDPTLPFLGIHITKMIDGSLTVGPNAVLGLKREGYNSQLNVSLKDTMDSITAKGFLNLVSNNWSHAIKEYKNSWFKSGYLKQVNKYCSEIKKADLQSYPVGIRAQAVNQSGELIHDFHFMNTKRSMHVCNAPSPAATSAMPIAKHIVELFEKRV